jgi:hypothetical protein
MDLSQTKLTKAEWISIEIPVSDQEKTILKLIHDGYENLNVKTNDHKSILSLMKMEYNPEIEKYLFEKYFEKEILQLIESSSLFKNRHVSRKNEKDKKTKPVKPPKKTDLLRMQNMDHNIEKQKERVFEFSQIEFCSYITNAFADIKTKKKIEKKNKKNNDYIFYLYTLVQMKKSTISNVNKYVTEFVSFIIDTVCIENPNVCRDIFHNVYNIIEKNQFIFKYEDNSLYDHQKQLFQLFKNSQDRQMLVLYTAATGTGKTISPIGLSVGNRIIYICAARHVGLALAKSAISTGKCVAFAFGCETANDIRLHYYSAKEFTKNKRSGAIAKVDNSDGSKVEIMICDVGSYLTAMFYMLSFNDESKIILYWDEPTISLDQETHPLHEIIHKNWRDNKISKVVLSCATLPKENEIIECLDDFRFKFDRATIHSISSFDCKKSISILDSKGKCVLPHLLFEDYYTIQACVEHCIQNLSLLRYFDLSELVRFVRYVEPLLPEIFHIKNYFDKISDITMNNVKMYYLDVLKNIPVDKYDNIYVHIKSTVLPKFSGTDSGILLTTEDAHTLTDGPTIFIVEDVVKIGNFYIQESKIPTKVFDNIMDKIHTNNLVQKKMDVLTKSYDDIMGKESEKEKKMEKELVNPEARKMMNNIEILRADIKMIAMDHIYVPNTVPHQQYWIKNKQIVDNAFMPTIQESAVREIMELDVSTEMKLLLLLGIGVFDISNTNIRYMEVMKRLATDQNLFLIIASSDFIYGTNYQFCHGILGKDLLQMTQQKTIQALGRIGRGNIQQEYTVRFRDDSILTKLFLPPVTNIEAENLSKFLRN